eukprot:12760220-Ditylum_brightwellii.AAC.1
MLEEAKFKACLAVKNSLAQSEPTHEELLQLQWKKDNPVTKPMNKHKTDISTTMKRSKITRKEYMIL